MSLAFSLALLAACGDDAAPSIADGGPLPDAGADAGSATADGGTEDAGTDAGSVDAGAPPACTSFADAVVRGTIESDELVEISGAVASRRQPGVLFVHNDSGESVPRFFAIDDTGRHRGELVLEGASFNDWEDIAIAPSPGGYDLYLGDVGDNEARTSMGERGRARVTVYRVSEPDVPLDGAPVTLTLDTFDTLRFVYPDHPHDCEAIFVDPTTGDLYFITKENDGMSTVFRAASPIATSGDVTLEAAGAIAFATASAPGGTQCTAADISPAGDAILARTYGSVLRWPIAASIGESLGMPATRLPAAAELQGEAVAFAADGRGYFTISEGAAAPVHFYACTDSP
jgi:hypothetical protein